MTWHLCHRAWLKGEFHCRLQPGKCVLRRPKREALWVKRSTSERAPAVTGVNWGRDQGGPAPLVPSLVPVGRQCLCSEEASTMGHVPAREGDGWRAQGCHEVRLGGGVLWVQWQGFLPEDLVQLCKKWRFQAQTSPPGSRLLGGRPGSCVCPTSVTPAGLVCLPGVRVYYRVLTRFGSGSGTTSTPHPCCPLL